MKNLFTLFLYFIIIPIGFAQNNLLWQGYFSYNQVNDISESPNKVYAASENAFFSKNISTSDLKTYTTINGLSGETISAIYHSQTFNKTLIGYENGLLIVVNENDGSMFKAIGIIQKQIPANIKKINHFYENDGIVNVSCSFGIVQFNLNTLEFGNTYFLGASVSDYQEVIQTTIYNNAIYAVTRNNGIKKGDLSNPNLNDFSQWQTFDSGYWNGIVTLNNQLVASNASNTLYKWNGTGWISFFNFTQSTVDFRVYNNYLIATYPTKLVVFDSQFMPIIQISNSSIPNIMATFTRGTFMNNVVYIGTLEDGMFSTTISNSTLFENISPNGPSRNKLFAINAASGNLWAVYGGYSADYNPYTYNTFYSPNTYGISKYISSGWQNKPYSAVLGAKALTKITVNPNNKNQIYISSFFNGILKVVNDIPTTLYNSSNSSLVSLVTNSNDNIRINGTAFDKDGNLWTTNCRVKNAISVLKPNNTWQSVSVESISPNFINNDYGNIVVDKNGTKWMASTKDGVIAYNENNNPVLKKISLDPGNLPVTRVNVVAIDTRNQLWIGTISGLRVLSSIDSFLTNDPLVTNSIIIEDNGLAQELFYEQNITDIVVDGSNRKWVGTADSGVFLITSDGQQTIYHFTKDTSPLPSDTVMDIEINGDTGEVYLATDKGMISFKGTSTKASDNLENVYVYPNPVRPEFTGTVKISGLIDKANVKIADIEGNLVYETTSAGGTIEWDTTAFGKYRVASGVYLIFIAAQDGTETKVKKVMIIR